MELNYFIEHDKFIDICLKSLICLYLMLVQWLHSKRFYSSCIWLTITIKSLFHSLLKKRHIAINTYLIHGENNVNNLLCIIRYVLLNNTKCTE